MKLSELRQAVNWCFNKFGDMEVEYIYLRDYNIRVLDTIQLSGGNELDRKFTIKGYDIRE
jgi:hypothetical protein